MWLRNDGWQSKSSLLQLHFLVVHLVLTVKNYSINCQCFWRCLPVITMKNIVSLFQDNVYNCCWSSHPWQITVKKTLTAYRRQDSNSNVLDAHLNTPSSTNLSCHFSIREEWFETMNCFRDVCDFTYAVCMRLCFDLCSYLFCCAQVSLVNELISLNKGNNNNKNTCTTLIIFEPLGLS